MLRKDRWRLIFMAAVIAVSAIVVLRGKVNLGLDLRGGAHIVLQASGTKDVPLTPDSLDRLRTVLEKRVNQYGLTEPTLQKQGVDRMIVDLPGVEDPQAALRLIGSTALLEFREVIQTLYSAAPLPPQAERKNYDSDEEFNAAVKRWNDYRTQVEEAKGLAVMLRAGALPVYVSILENRSVGPSLGSDSINAGAYAGMIGLAAVFLFMLLYYRLWGVTADLSLCTTLLVLFALLMAFKATLTLPGIAGIILTIGMAVDSNILIFERIREETRAGKTPNAALTSGFSNALTTILDSNITTVIAAAVLYYYGSGPLRGFAMTLTLGIIASLFSALVVNRVLLQLMVNYGSKTFQARK